MAQPEFSPAEQARLIPSLWTRAQLSEIEAHEVHAARVWAMREAALGHARLMTEEFARELHRRMFRGIWRGAGKYRTEPVSGGWDPARISEGVRLFLEDAEGWISHSTYSVAEAAVRLHYRLVAVRPWFTGNGRHARLLADVVVAAYGEPALAWGARTGPNPRERYVGALRAADSGEFAPLVAFARGTPPA